ncbi:MAG: sugar transferase, partial [Actinobacteria bacterium]|nr:sugar transferase [Actinomycetota bacterium]
MGSTVKHSHTVYDLVKRVADLFVSAVALVVLSPVFAVVALIVRLKLGSPVIFRQQRPGKDGHIFAVYKFRTMRDAA